MIEQEKIDDVSKLNRQHVADICTPFPHSPCHIPSLTLSVLNVDSSTYSPRRRVSIEDTRRSNMAHLYSNSLHCCVLFEVVCFLDVHNDTTVVITCFRTPKTHCTAIPYRMQFAVSTTTYLSHIEQ